jgi:hypothetical protein
MFSPVGGELMADKHYFPVHAGMLTEEHRERIGKAIWEFLWCLSKTTKETIEDGDRVGVVLGGKPITFKEVADEFGISRSTVRRNFEILELENYISLLETPRGHVIKVMRSKKFKDARDSKTDTGSKIDTPQRGSSSAQGGSKTEHSNKDIKKDIKITTTAEALKSNQPVDTGMPLSVTKEIVSTQQAVINRYLELRRAISASPHDLSAAEQIARAGVPAEMAVKFLEEKFAIFEESKAWPDAKINSLRYCEGFIIERYHAHKQAEQEAATSAKVRPLGSLNGKARTVSQPYGKQRKKDINNALLDRYMEEN